MTTLLDDRPFTPLAESLPRLEAACSPLVGIVTGEVATMSATDEAPLPHCAYVLGSATRVLGAPTVEYGSGAHPDPSQARAAALGEALERYSGVFLPAERLRRATVRQLGDAAVSPSRFALFHPSQFEIPRFPLVPFTDDTLTTFVEGVDLRDGSSTWLPADMVYMTRPRPAPPPISYSTSNGLACGPSFEEATLGALLELVERDAVMLAWKCRLSLPLLEWSDDRELTALERRFFAPSGLCYGVIDGSSFLNVPIAISVLHGPRGSGAALCVGAGAAARIQEAWLKALAESFGVYRWLRSPVARNTEPPDSPDAVESFDDHMRFYADDERAALASFLVASAERRPTHTIPPLEGATPRAQIEAIVGRLADHGISAFVVDVTAPDVRELGVSVARVVSPELCGLDVSHRARFLGGERLTRAAYDAGLLAEPLALEDLNPLPHPFP
ncbi:MAG TPA: YcaO-like family protein [Gaiella sp.]|nr:YcaO-like family protein [Gaiella sp.]